MRSIHFISIAGLLFLVACSDLKKPSDSTLTKAINRYLMKHDEACTVIDRQFPVDVPKSQQNEQYGIGPKLAVLEQAGLVHGSDTTAVVHEMLDPLRGSTPPQPVKRYELTAEGRKYFEEIPGTLGHTNGFCYGRTSVESIVKWTEPTMVGPYSQTEVTFACLLVHILGPLRQSPSHWAKIIVFLDSDRFGRAPKIPTRARCQTDRAHDFYGRLLAIRPDPAIAKRICRVHVYAVRGLVQRMRMENQC